MWKVRAVPGSLPGLSPLGLGPASPCCEPGDSRQGPVGFPAAGPWPGPPRSPVQLRRRIDAGANRRTAHSGPAGVSFHTFSGHRSGSHWTSSVASPTEGRDLCPSGYVAVIAVAKPFNEGFHSARCRALTHPPPEMRTRPVRAGASSPCGGKPAGDGSRVWENDTAPVPDLQEVPAWTLSSKLSHCGPHAGVGHTATEWAFLQQ